MDNEKKMDNKTKKKKNNSEKKSNHSTKKINNSKKVTNSSKISISSIQTDEINQIKTKIQNLQKKIEYLENSNSYYYALLQKQFNPNNNDNFFPQNNSQIEQFIEQQRTNNLTGYNKSLMDITKKIDEFMFYENQKQQETINYMKNIQNLKNDIDARLKIMILVNEKEKEKDRQRKKEPYYILNFDKSYKNFPARICKDGMALSNKYVSIDHPEQYKKYYIYDRYKEDYYHGSRYNDNGNILRKSASSIFG